MDAIFFNALSINEKALAIAIITHHKVSHYLYKHFKPELKNQDDFIDAFLKQDHDTIYAIHEKKVTKQRLLQCLSSVRFFLIPEVIPDELKTDHALLEAIANSRSENFFCIPQDNPNYVSLLMTAIQNDGRLIEELSAEQQHDQTLVKAALHSYSGAIRYLELTEKNRERILQTLRKSGKYLSNLSPSLRDQDDIVKAALSSGKTALEYASDRLKADKTMVTYAAQCNQENLRYAAKHLHFDSTILSSGITFFKYYVATCEGAQHLILANSHIKKTYHTEKERLLDFLFRTFTYINMNSDSVFFARKIVNTELYVDWRALQCFMHILLVTQLKYPHSQTTPASARLPSVLLGILAQFLCGDIPGFMPLLSKSINDIPHNFRFRDPVNKQNTTFSETNYTGNGSTMAQTIMAEYNRLLTIRLYKRVEHNQLVETQANRTVENSFSNANC